jgi:hypothetical protein
MSLELGVYAELLRGQTISGSYGECQQALSGLKSLQTHRRMDTEAVTVSLNWIIISVAQYEIENNDPMSRNRH